MCDIAKVLANKSLVFGVYPVAKMLFDEAVNTANEIKDIAKRMEILKDIAKSLALAGFKNESEELFDKIIRFEQFEDDVVRPIKLSHSLINKLGKKRKEELELIIVRSINLSFLAATLMKAGFHQKAVDVAKKAISFAKTIEVLNYEIILWVS